MTSLASVGPNERRRYAREAARALAPLRRQTAPIEAYLSSLVRDAERLSQYRDPDDWYEVYENMWDPFAPWRSGHEGSSGRPTHADPERDAPPARRDDLLATYEAVRTGYGGPDLSAELAEAAAAVEAAHTVWADLANRFNAIEALRPPQPFPGLPVSGDAMRDRQAQTAAYRDAFQAAEEPFAQAARHLRRHRDALIDLKRRLATEYDPERLARRDTPDPFPRWVWRSALAAAATAAAVWAWLARSGSGQLARDITDNVLVGAAAAATGVALAAIAQRLADERVAREGKRPVAESSRRSRRCARPPTRAPAPINSPASGRPRRNCGRWSTNSNTSRPTPDSTSTAISRSRLSTLGPTRRTDQHRTATSSARSTRATRHHPLRRARCRRHRPRP